MRDTAKGDIASSGLEFAVRPCGFSDWTGLHRLLQCCFAPMEKRIDPPSSLNRMSPDDLRRKAENETLVLVRSGRELVACGFFAEHADALYLGKLAVRPDFRRRGILRSIVSIAEETARDKSIKALVLQTRIELVENHATFQALGFTRTGETCHAGYNRPTSITMRKPLQAMRHA